LKKAASTEGVSMKNHFLTHDLPRIELTSVQAVVAPFKPYQRGGDGAPKPQREDLRSAVAATAPSAAATTTGDQREVCCYHLLHIFGLGKSECRRGDQCPNEHIQKRLNTLKPTDLIPRIEACTVHQATKAKLISFMAQNPKKFRQ
jgi:hypothetical protein